MYATRARASAKAKGKDPAGEQSRGDSPQRSLLSQDRELESPQAATTSAALVQFAQFPPIREELGDDIEDPSVIGTPVKSGSGIGSIFQSSQGVSSSPFKGNSPSTLIASLFGRNNQQVSALQTKTEGESMSATQTITTQIATTSMGSQGASSSQTLPSSSSNPQPIQTAQAVTSAVMAPGPSVPGSSSSIVASVPMQNPATATQQVTYAAA